MGKLSKTSKCYSIDNIPFSISFKTECEKLFNNEKEQIEKQVDSTISKIEASYNNIKSKKRLFEKTFLLVGSIKKEDGNQNFKDIKDNLEKLKAHNENVLNNIYCLLEYLDDSKIAEYNNFIDTQANKFLKEGPILKKYLKSIMLNFNKDEINKKSDKIFFTEDLLLTHLGQKPSNIHFDKLDTLLKTENEKKSEISTKLNSLYTTINDFFLQIKNKRAKIKTISGYTGSDNESKINDLKACNQDINKAIKSIKEEISKAESNADKKQKSNIQEIKKTIDDIDNNFDNFYLSVQENRKKLKYGGGAVMNYMNNLTDDHTKIRLAYENFGDFYFIPDKYKCDEALTSVDDLISKALSLKKNIDNEEFSTDENIKKLIENDRKVAVSVVTTESGLKQIKTIAENTLKSINEIKLPPKNKKDKKSSINIDLKKIIDISKKVLPTFIAVAPKILPFVANAKTIEYITKGLNGVNSLTQKL